MDGGRSQYVDIVEAVLTRLDAERWDVDAGELWCALRPPEPRTPSQGWKLHVSATLLTAPVVLARAAEILVRDGCAFKFATGPAQLGVLLSNVVDRGSGGKFITVYPADDEQFRAVAGKLDRVTDGLGGPRILSDRQLRPGSSVYYRYGAFARPSYLDNDGVLVSMLVGPDGEQVKDVRGPVFRAPGWAVPPVADACASTASGTVLVGDRFVVRSAIRHSYRGGVFRATDRRTGAAVVLKQARPHVMSSPVGTDARDLLRHEARVLDALAATGAVPAMVDLVAHQENLFLAQEEVSGVTLLDWVTVRAADEWHGTGAPWDVALDHVGRLVDLVAAVHDRGWVLRDLKPGNVMVTPDGRLRLIDLETAVRAGRRALPVGTAGYLPPELVDASGTVTPSPRADLYGLGATVLYLLSGIDPALAPDSAPRRPVRERLDLLLSVAGEHMPSVARLSPLVRNLTDDDPHVRWDLARVREFLNDAAESETATPLPAADDPRPAAAVDRMLRDGLRHLLATATPDGFRLWPTDATTDPSTVHSGAAGVLGLFVRATRVLPDPELRDGMAMAAGWIDRRLFDVPRILPGLYQGRAGVAWALHDAALLLRDDAVAERAIEHARRLPLRWPVPDVFHGAAGAGLAQLHLWTSTGDPELKRRAGFVADGLIRARDGRFLWPMPDRASFDSAGAGRTYHGFAHGAAGIGAFLVYSALATGREDHLDAARAVGATLESVTDLDATAAFWPAEVGEAPVRRRHWCHGSSGVGTFLVRLWLATGEPRFRDLAEAAATACYRARWQALNAACHGLAGDGEFLLDLAELTGEPRYRDWAWEFAAILHARHTVRDGLMLPADNSAGGRITTDHGNGVTGVLGFLLRLRHGGHRAWMPDRLLPPHGNPHPQER